MKELAALISPGEGGSSFGYRAEMGRNAHLHRQTILRRQYPDFDGEYQISYHFEFSGTAIVLRGRPDAVYRDGEYLMVEEIKSVLTSAEAFQHYTIAALDNFRTQLDLYLYLLRLEGKTDLKGRLHLINLAESGGEKTFDYIPDFSRTALALETVFSRILSENERRKNHHLDLQYAAEALDFPFTEYRPYQKRMSDDVASIVESGGRLLLSAPTGIGKTVGVLYPALKTAFKLDKKLYFATSKTTQRLIVRDLVDKFKQKSAPFSALFLTARAKICPTQAEICDWDTCPYIDGFAEKMLRFSFIEEMFEGAVFDGEAICRKVLPVKMCPFAVSLALSEFADLIVGDYNYIFDPRIMMRRIFSEGGADKYILIVDEAHNLPDRIRNCYSPEIAYGDVELLLASLKGKASQWTFHKNSAHFLRNLIKILHGLSGETRPVELSLSDWNALLEEAETLIMQYNLSPSGMNFDKSDPLLKFLYDFTWFAKTAGLGDGIAFLYDKTKRLLKAVCLDPGLRLKEMMDSFHSVIAMSATLAPGGFFSEMLGLYDTASSLNLPNPFPAENRQIRIIPEVSTLFKFRSRFVPRIAEIIDGIYTENPGGYFVFFPSYAYMRETAQLIKSPVILQQSEMDEDSRTEFLRQVAEGGKLFLAVLGGVFAEGVDYPGQLAGVIVVGPGLPLYCAETEMMREYFDRQYGRGFEYAYVYPGMNRVIQAAGRLIRSETDRGSITLICSRFLQEPYRSLIPRDWYVEGVEELAGKSGI